MEQQFYLNTYSERPLTDRIIQIIHGARYYIKTGNFFFREPGIMEELKDACRRGVTIFILSNLRDDIDRLPAGNKLGKSEYDPHLPNLADLVELGAHVRFISELHAKFIVADGTLGMIMSSNYTKDSLKGNPECGVDLNAEDTKYLGGVFDTIFSHADIKLQGRDHHGYVLKRIVDPVEADCFDEGNPNVLLTLGAATGEDGIREQTNFVDCNIQDIYQAIANTINEANEWIIMAAYSFRNLSKLPLIRSALINAAERQVAINIVCNDSVEYSMKEIARMEQAIPSLKAEGFPKNHAKFLLTESEGLMFTANIDGKAGLLSGFELGVYLSDLQWQQAVEGLRLLQKEKEDLKG